MRGRRRVKMKKTKRGKGTDNPPKSVAITIFTVKSI